MKVILLGAPGAGKGTQAEIISKKLNIPAISTGFIIRGAIAADNEVGRLAKGYIAKGQLVPDDVITKILFERLEEDDCKNGYILDGFPRTIPQAEALLNSGIEIDCVLEIDIDDKTVIERLSGRRECSKCGKTYHILHNKPSVEGICDACGGDLRCRKDDNPDTIKERLVVYHNQTEPLKEFYKEKGMLVSAKSCDSVEDTTTAVLKALGVEK